MPIRSCRTNTRRAVAVHGKRDVERGLGSNLVCTSGETKPVCLLNGRCNQNQRLIKSSCAAAHSQINAEKFCRPPATQRRTCPFPSALSCWRNSFSNADKVGAVLRLVGNFQSISKPSKDARYWDHRGAINGCSENPASKMGARPVVLLKFPLM